MEKIVPVNKNTPEIYSPLAIFHVILFGPLNLEQYKFKTDLSIS